MSVLWSRESLRIELKDVQANSLAIDKNGILCSLAGKQCLAIVNLNRKGSILKQVTRVSKWDVAGSEWNSFHKDLFALGSNQIVEVYSWAEYTGVTKSHSWSNFNSNGKNSADSKPLKHQRFQPSCILKGHTRCITDINWSPFNPGQIASSSFDTFTHIWDLRDTKKPQLSLTSVASANHVKWSKSDENLIATSHDADMRIWDRRKGNIPIHYIAAHLSKIYGIDWSPVNGTQLSTCSLDCTVKFWDLAVLKNKAERILQTGLPVWRAKYTLFGSGLITVIVPQLRRSLTEHNSLWLWNLNSLDQPVHSFIGNSDIILEIGWKSKERDTKADLVTWSRDNCIRIWDIDNQIIKLVSQEDSSPDGIIDSDLKYDRTKLSLDATNIPTDMNKLKQELSPPTGVAPNFINPNITRIRHFSGVAPSVLAPTDLQDEFNLINFNIPNLKIEKLNAARRLCIITAASVNNMISCKLKISFPSSYPNNAPPNFIFLGIEESNEQEREKKPYIEMKSELIKVLQNAAHLQVKRNRPCLEHCLRQLILSLEKFGSSSESSISSVQPHITDISSLYTSFQDQTVPFPRTSGGRFCGADLLICFSRPPHLQQLNAPTEFTPRSLSALSTYLSSYRALTPPSTSTNRRQSESDLDANQPTVSSFYADKKKRKSTVKLLKYSSERNILKAQMNSSKAGPVIIYNIVGLLPISKVLAETYVFDDDLLQMCIRNRKAAEEVSRKDLVQVWSLMSLVAKTYQSQYDDSYLMDAPFSFHPFGRKLFQSLINHYISIHDIQTCAMLSCLFSGKHKGNSGSNRLACGQKNNFANNCPTNSILKALNKLLKPGNSPYHTVHGPPGPITPYNEISLEDWNLIYTVESLKRNRSNSWSDSVENDFLPLPPFNTFGTTSTTSSATYRYHCNEMTLLSEQREAERHETNLKMIESKQAYQLDILKQLYEEILLRWSLFKQKSQINSYIKIHHNYESMFRHGGVDFVAECLNCHKNCRSPKCHTCKQK